MMTNRGIVATCHYLASQAGAQILAKGRTAMDAAIPWPFFDSAVLVSCTISLD
jgi:gamma-glutamyltranspeptidase